jgi:hypothetical protein
MPALEVITVVSLTGCSSVVPKILVVRTGPGRVVIVIPWRGTSAIFVSAPGLVVAGCKFLGGAIWIGIITGGKDRSGDLIEQYCRGGGTGERTLRDIACANKDCIFSTASSRSMERKLSPKKNESAFIDLVIDLFGRELEGRVSLALSSGSKVVGKETF